MLVVFVGDRMGQSLCVGCVCGGSNGSVSVCWLCLWGIEWVSLCVLVVFVGDRMGQSLCVGCVCGG